MNKEHDKKLQKIIEAIDKVYPTTPQMIWRSLLNGLFTAIGATVGLALVVSIVTYIVTQASFIPREYRNDIQKVLPKR